MDFALNTDAAPGERRKIHVQRYRREALQPGIAPVGRRMILSLIAECVPGLPKPCRGTRM
jgi:hypothetical protein